MADRDGATHLITEINVEKELEVSFVRRGSNPLSKVILKKSAEESTHQPEKTDMLKSVALAALMSTSVGAALAKSFTKDEELDTFLAKDEAGQSAELAAFAKAKGMPWGDDTKAESTKKEEPVVKGEPGADALGEAIAKAVQAAVAPLQKTLEDTQARLTEVSGNVTKGGLEKAATTIYKGLGLGTDTTVSILKAVDGIEDAEIRKHVTDIMAAHAAMAEKVARSVGLANLEKREGSATQRLAKAVAEYKAEKRCTLEEAEIAIQEDLAYADLLAEVDREQGLDA